nr:hypothetical protein [uncultured Gemmiger sp.]
MKHLFWNRIPSVCICFTLIILSSVLVNVVYGVETSVFPIVVFGWIVICQAIDWLISFLNFKSWWTYCLTESLILYTASFAVGTSLHWFALEPAGILTFTAIFMVVDALLFWYFRYRQKLMADEINMYLQR